MTSNFVHKALHENHDFQFYNCYDLDDERLESAFANCDQGRASLSSNAIKRFSDQTKSYTPSLSSPTIPEEDRSIEESGLSVFERLEKDESMSAKEKLEIMSRFFGKLSQMHATVMSQL